MVSFPIDPTEARSDADSLKLQIQGLFDSYHDADVDFLAENIQNAVDALEDKFEQPDREETPQLEIEIDTDEYIFTIRDNGGGIPEDIISKLGSPANSNKEEGSKRGYKGVGLTYAAWSAEKFVFETKRPSEDQSVAGELDGGRQWIEGDSDNYPVIDEIDRSSDFLESQTSGTIFEFHLDQSSSAIKFLQRLNEEGIKDLLKTKTAIGYVTINYRDLEDYPDWVDETNITFDMTSRDPITLDMGYAYPHKYEVDSRVMHLDDKSDLSIEDLEKQQGTHKLIYTEITNEEIENIFLDDEGEVRESDQDAYAEVTEQNVTAYGAFVDRKSTLRDYNDDFYLPNPGRGAKRQIVNNGYHISTATMPCGNRQRIELSYGGGNANRLYFLFDFDDASPDEGRKTYAEEIDTICDRVVSSFASDEFVPNRKLLIQHDRAHGPTESDQEMTVHQAKENAQNKDPLGVDGFGVGKIPAEEQEVVGLFHSLMGGDILKGYDVLSSHGSQEKYDGVFEYDLRFSEVDEAPEDPLSMVSESFTGTDNRIEFPPRILEYKYQVSSLISDFENDEKAFDDIKLLIAWQQGEENAFTGASNYRLEEIDSVDPGKQFYGTTYWLKPTDSTGKIHVILLQDIIGHLS